MAIKHNMNTKKKQLESLMISNIARRAVDSSRFTENELIGLVMDIHHTHKICPLDLERFYESDQENFLHDIYGIYNNFNRETLKLENCFLPRFSA